MNKAKYFLASLFILLNINELQAAQPNDKTTTAGLLLFCGTAACWTAGQAWNCSVQAAKKLEKSSPTDDKLSSPPQPVKINSTTTPPASNPNADKRKFPTIYPKPANTPKAVEKKIVHSSSTIAAPQPPQNPLANFLQTRVNPANAGAPARVRESHEQYQQQLAEKRADEIRSTGRLLSTNRHPQQGYSSPAVTPYPRTSQGNMAKTVQISSPTVTAQPAPATSGPLLLTHDPEWREQQNELIPQIKYTDAWHAQHPRKAEDQQTHTATLQTNELARQAVRASLRKPRNDPQHSVISKHLQGKLNNSLRNQHAQAMHAESTTTYEFNRLIRTNDRASILEFLDQYVTRFSEPRADNERNFGLKEKGSEATKKSKISTRYTFQPKGKIYDKVIIIKIAHGTNGRSHGFGGDETRDSSEWLQIYGQHRSRKENALVILDAIDWSGKLSSSERKDAGIALAEQIRDDIKELQDQHPGITCEVETIGHSLGTSVTSIGAHELEKDGISVAKATFLGSPHLDVTPSNVKSTWNIFGAADITGSLGSWLSSWGKSTSLRKPTDDTPHAKNVKNILLKLDGKDTDHVSVKAAMHYLVLMEMAFENSFENYQDFIVNIHDASDQTQKIPFAHAVVTSTTQADDEDSADEFCVPTAIPVPNMQVAVMIDERYTLDGCDPDAINTKDMIHSDTEMRKFRERYGRSIYEEPTTFDSVISEASSANVPPFVLTILRQTQNQTKNTFWLAQTITDSTRSFFSYVTTWWRPASPISESSSPASPARVSSSPTPSPLVMLDEKITATLQSLRTEPSFNNQRYIIALLYSTVFECDDEKMQDQMKATINTALETKNKILMQWQGDYERIISTTRSDDNPNWDDAHREKIYKAKAIYQRASSNQGESWSEILSGYEKLDDYTQQALVAAIAQGLKTKDIEAEAQAYLQQFKPASGKSSPVAKSGSPTSGSGSKSSTPPPTTP